MWYFLLLPGHWRRCAAGHANGPMTRGREQRFALRRKNWNPIFRGDLTPQPSWTVFWWMSVILNPCIAVKFNVMILYTRQYFHGAFHGKITILQHALQCYVFYTSARPEYQYFWAISFIILASCCLTAMSINENLLFDPNFF